MSSPESISSSTATAGSNIAACSTSFCFFSPPEKPALRYRCMNFSSMSSSSIFSERICWNSATPISPSSAGPSIGEVSYPSSSSSASASASSSSNSSSRSSALALSACRRKFVIVTPSISAGYWNPRKIPSAARSLGSSSSSFQW